MGTRMGGETPKQFLELDGSPILLHTLRRLASCEALTEIILATRADEIARLEERCRQEEDSGRSEQSSAQQCTAHAGSLSIAL